MTVFAVRCRDLSTVSPPDGFGSLGGFSHCQTRTQFGLSSEVLGMGCIRSFDLRNGFNPLLVYGHDPGFSRDPRPAKER